MRTIIRAVCSSFSPGRNMFANLEDMAKYVKGRVVIDRARDEWTGLSTGMSSMSVYRMHRINTANLTRHDLPPDAVS